MPSPSSEFLSKQNKKQIQKFDDDDSRIVRIGSVPLPEQQFCPLLNVSQCEPSESGSRFVVTAYNPLSRPVTTYIRLPVRQGSHYTVFDPVGITFQ